MIETKRMKSPTKSLDVFEFKEEDELTEMTVKKIAPRFGYPNAVDVSRTKIQSEENDSAICGVSDAASIDYNHDAGGSFTLIETHGSVYARVECGSSLGVTVRLEDQPNCAFQDSSCNVYKFSPLTVSRPEMLLPDDGLSFSYNVQDKSVRFASDADESMSQRSPPAITNSNASSDGPSSDNCFSDCNLGDKRVGIVFYPDYIDYCGTHYLDSMVSFSRSFVEARSKTIYGNEETFHIQLEIKDIVKIESQWSAQYESGIISIYFILRDAACPSVSGIHELKFPAVDPNWYEKLEAIESLDASYKPLWSVLLDIGMEKCSALPEGEAMLLTRSYFPNFDRPFEEVIYPKGDPDAVSISKRDIDLLLPDTYVNDTIIDFYIKYLKSRRSVEEKARFHFFNCFFFRKLADMDKDPSSAFDGKAAFQRVRKWTRKVNLLEKDFIFIPINYNYHWSLIVICYFGEVASDQGAEDNNSVKVPCILHMDSFRGSHVGLKDLIQSYLWEEWKERQKGASDDLYSKFRNLKFIPLELPQQQNAYDCGLFLLHYVELFLEDVPTNFNIYKVASSSKFLQADWFPPVEASLKRAHIERLIKDLLDTQSKCDSPCGGSGMHCSPEGLNSHKNDVAVSVKDGPSGGFGESSLCDVVRQGIEMTLLPASSMMSTQCTRTSGLVLKELFKQASAPESFNDAPWGALDRREPLHEFKRHVPLTEEEVEASECLIQTELAEPVFQHLDGVNPDPTTFPYCSGDFKLEAVHQPASDDVDSSPVTSGCESDDIIEIVAGEKYHAIEAVSLDDELYNKCRCKSSDDMEQLTVSFALSSGELLHAEETHNLVDISDRNRDSFFLKNFPEVPNAMQANDFPSTICTTFASDDKLDVSDSEKTYQDGEACLPALSSNYLPMSSGEGHGGLLVTESDDEQHVAKRMKITPPDGNLPNDLHL